MSWEKPKPEIDPNEILDKLSEETKYELDLETIKEEENEIRNYMYDPDYESYEMNLDPYFNLFKIDKTVWDNICEQIIRMQPIEGLYFKNARYKLRKRITKSWEEIEKSAKQNNIKEYFGKNADHVYLAGGAALSVLLAIPCSDEDYFTTREISPWEIKSNGQYDVSPHVINFSRKKQLIKRLYKQPHEIIHSFDIDCCCIMINSAGEIYATARCIYALINGYNTVDFEYMSPSYEWRLIKYATRGFSIHVPGVENCSDPDLLYEEEDDNVCYPDSIWSYGDIYDILNGPMLKALLMNATGLQKIMLASSAADDPRVHEIITGKLSDYDVEITNYNRILGKLFVDGKYYKINGSIGYGVDPNDPEQSVMLSYKGTIYKLSGDDEDNQNDEDESVKEFSRELSSKLIDIILSPYKIVNPGEQTTSTFNKLVFEDPDVWYYLDKEQLFEDALYTFLYFKNYGGRPSLYDDKVDWFGEDIKNKFVYHFARLALNERIYNNFNGITVTTIKISYGDSRPKSLIYNDLEYEMNTSDSKGIFGSLIDIGEAEEIFTEQEFEILKSLFTKIKPGIIPQLDMRNRPE